MGPTSYTNQSPDVTQSSSVPSGGSANPVLDALSAAVQHAQKQVQLAQEQVSKTPQTVQISGGQPTMPVAKPNYLEGASQHNLDHIQPQTRAGARAKGIGQIAGAAGNIIGKYMAKKEAEKTQNLAQDIHRSMELNQGIDEANQVLQQDPNNAAAKAQVQKNTTLLKALLDGKNGKQVAKAYDITLGPAAQADAEKNAKKPEKAAMTQAMKQMKQDQEHKSSVEQFRGQLPSQMGPNPAYTAAQKNALEVQKQADALTKTYTTMAGTVYKEQHADDRNAATNAKAAEVAKINAKGKTDTEQLRLTGEAELNKQKHQEKMAEIGAQGAQRMAQIKEVKKAGDNLKGQKMAEDYAKSTEAAMGKVRDGITKVDVELNKPENKQSENSAAHKALQNQKDMLTQTLQSLQEQKDQAVMEMHSDPDAAAMYNLIGKDEEQ